MVDALVRIDCLIDAYRLHHKRAARQAFMDGEFGYHASSQFNHGQEFVLDYVIKDLESLRSLLVVVPHD